jgi:superfamily II DNA or RNA helicase
VGGKEEASRIHGSTLKTLRDYQNAMIHGGMGQLGILPALNSHPSALCVAATGLGKSVVISKVVSGWKSGLVVCVAHRIELVNQLAEHLKSDLGWEPIIEQADRGLSADLRSIYEDRNAIVASIQTLSTKRRRVKFAGLPVGLGVIDEAHRSTGNSYSAMAERFRTANPQFRLLGVTATPKRTDGTALGLMFDSIACHLDINWGIDNGYLVDIHQRFAKVKSIDFTGIRQARNEYGERDFNQADLEARLIEEKPLHEMSKTLLELTENGQQAIIFAAGVPHAHLWAAVLNRYRPGCAVSICGTTDSNDRSKAVMAYREGSLQFLVNYGIFTEGFDAPSTDMIIMGRMTGSELVYTQMLGRGTRTLPGTVDGFGTPEERKVAIASSRKPFLTVLDFVGNTKHGIVTATDILGGSFDDDTRRIARNDLGGKMGSRDGSSVREALKRAKMLSDEEQRKRDFIRASKVEYEIREIERFGRLNASEDVGVRGSEQARGGSTDAQIALLQKLGISYQAAAGFSIKQAGAIITDLRDKRCTVPQAAQLKRFGYDPASFNVKSASKMISRIAANGWRRPKDENRGSI